VEIPKITVKISKTTVEVPKTNTEELEHNLEGENKVLLLTFVKMLKWKPEESNSVSGQLVMPGFGIETISRVNNDRKSPS
jgi:hypothetical protein